MATKDLSIEAFRKSIGGKFYRIVRIRVSGTLVEVGDFLAESDEAAIKKAIKALESALEIAKNNSTNP